MPPGYQLSAMFRDRSSSEGSTDGDRFAGTDIDRRTFVKLSAATGAALALPGNATASASAETFDAEYEYALNHTPTDHRVPTVVQFEAGADPTALETFDENAVIVTDPEPAAYGRLTATEAETAAAELPEASRFQFAPGSNPFWRVGSYPFGVFPEPRRSVDYIGFEQLKDGLRELEGRYPDRVNVRVAGRSPGHYNNATDREDPKDMLVVELTNDVQDREAFREKEKVFHSCSLHGPERAGAEAGARVVENVARSSEPDIQGSDAKIEPLLDDVVVLLGFTNPDGWVARNPQYDSGWQFTGPGTSLVVDEPPRIPAGPLYERGNAEVYDTNRQYPVVGMITPNHFPAQPDDPKSEEEETPSFVTEKVPDAKAFVDFFSQYENLNYGSDLHGGPIFNEFVLGLISQDQFDTRQIHELYEMCLNIDDTLEAALETWVTAGNVKKAVLGDTETGLLFGVLPEQAFDYSTIYDTIDYTVTGAFLDWMAHPEPIGLDLTTLDFEMSFSWAVNGNIYNPELVEMEVKGYRTAIRTITDFAVRNSDTPGTSDQFGTRTETAGDRVAYITTGEPGTQADALRSTDGDLVFDDGTTDSVSTDTESFTLSSGTTELTHTVESADLHSMGFHLHSHEVVADLEVVDPSGNTVATHEGVTEERAGGKCCGLPEFTVTDPEPGTWTIRVDSRREVEQPAEFRAWTLAATNTNPDPEIAWPGEEGFLQREYDVTPFDFFEDYAEFIDSGTMEPVTVAEVANGALFDTNGNLAYDHVVAIHDYGANQDAEYFGSTTGYTDADHPAEGFVEAGYTDALDTFVEAGGNLVLTDAGVNLLTELDNDLVDGSAISRDDIATPEFVVARFQDGTKNLGHPLFGSESDVRPIQNQLWKVQPLGHDPNGTQAPMFLPNAEALGAAGTGATTTVVGRAPSGDSDIVAASITPDDSTGTGVHVISSLLPTPTQRNLHPFGLQNYTVTFLGYVLFTSALGFVQVRETGETVRRYGRTDAWDTSEVEHLTGGGPTAAGSRGEPRDPYTPGATHRVDVTVTALSDSARVTDSLPSADWEVTGGDGEQNGDTVDLGTVNPVSENDDPVEFTYFVEVPDANGQFTFGPAEADGTPFGGTNDVTVVGGGTGGSGTESTLTGTRGFTDD